MHDKRCAATALIAAVENLRDQEGLFDSEFYAEVQNGAIWQCALGYLNDGTATCLCPPCEHSCCTDHYAFTFDTEPEVHES
jgi:hypothetical protein